MLKLIAELRRRSVFRVAATYMVVGWLLIQIAVALEQTLNLPSWFDTFITVLVLIGFPIALLLSWAFQVTPDGVRRDPGGAGKPDVPEKKIKGVDIVLIGALVVVGGMMVVDWVRPDGEARTPPGLATGEAPHSDSEEGPAFAVRRTALDQDPRIAVMPFVNMSNDPSNAFFADGISEEILNSLTRVRGINVIARTSSFALRGTNITVPEIGERLNADLVLEGSVRRAGNQVRVTAQLIETAEGHHLWSEVYERELDDLFGVQDEVSREIAGALPRIIQTGEIDAGALNRSRQINARAYRLYLEAKFLISQSRRARNIGEEESMFLLGERAERLIDEALELEPEYADALIVKGEIIRYANTRAYREQFQNQRESILAAEPYFQKAIELDPDSVEVLVEQAMVSGRYKWQWEEAGRLLERALEANPNHAEAHTDYAYHLSKVGRCIEALYHAVEGARLDGTNTWRELAIPRIQMQVYGPEQTEAYYQKMLGGGEANRWLLRDLFVHLFLNRNLDGLREMQESMAAIDWNRNTLIQEMGEIYTRWVQLAIRAFEGNPGPFVEHLNEITSAYDRAVAAGNDTDLFNDELWLWAVYYAWFGEVDQALHYYERAIQGEVLYLPQTFPYGLYEFPPEMRNHPRYRAIWDSRPELVELKKLRLQALQARQFRGILPDGTRVVPEG